MITVQHHLRNGYTISAMKSGEVSHICITDSNCYPDNDNRSGEYWRSGGLIVPINDNEDLEAIFKMFKKLKKE